MARSGWKCVAGVWGGVEYAFLTQPPDPLPGREGEPILGRIFSNNTGALLLYIK
jgi:hypothetical protein